MNQRPGHSFARHGCADPAPAAQNQRAFLFLQGPASPLFQWIATELERYGHHVWRINICTGDRLFWRRKGAANYRGRLDDWPAYLAQFIDRHKITEIILLGEERPHHRLAAGLAKAQGLPVYAVEKGYLRPDWISIEYSGSGCNSHFPVDMRQILDAAAGLEDPDFTLIHQQSFLAEAGYDLAYNLANVFLGFLYPHYRWHALSHPLAEYGGWIRRFLRQKERRRQTEKALHHLQQHQGKYFIYPLQLQTDYQLRVHSPFGSQMQAIDMVLASFAFHSAPTTWLVIKTHPLDNGLIDWSGYIAKTAQRLGINQRVHIVHNADLGMLLENCRGAVMINSTSGIKAIAKNRPVKVLGTAIYDLPGLTHQGTLDQFWSNPEPVCPQLKQAFLRLIASALHERGNFYSRAGALAGATAIARRIHLSRVNQPGAFVNPPPRPRPVKSESPE